tara:strand:- start:1224 stop:1358 length:135 start_codon:yes stop_codon:yes gene_type:complete
MINNYGIEIISVVIMVGTTLVWMYIENSYNKAYKKHLKDRNKRR